MKSFLLLVLTCIIAWLTVPAHSKFDKHLTKKERDTGKCPEDTRHYSYKLFTINYVDYCEGTDKKAKTRTDKYLGLFGTFFKI